MVGLAAVYYALKQGAIRNKTGRPREAGLGPGPAGNEVGGGAVRDLEGREPVRLVPSLSRRLVSFAQSSSLLYACSLGFLAKVRPADRLSAPGLCAAAGGPFGVGSVLSLQGGGGPRAPADGAARQARPGRGCLWLVSLRLPTGPACLVLGIPRKVRTLHLRNRAPPYSRHAVPGTPRPHRASKSHTESPPIFTHSSESRKLLWPVRTTSIFPLLFVLLECVARPPPTHTATLTSTRGSLGQCWQPGAHSPQSTARMP